MGALFCNHGMAVESLHYCLYFTLAIGYKWHHWVVIEIQEAKVTKIPQNESYFCKELYNISTNIFAHCFLVCHHFQQFMAFLLWEPVSMLQLFFFLGKYLVTTLRITSWKLLTKLCEKQPGQSVIFDDLLDFEVLESVK